jgi:hypothetical protein
MLLDNRLTNGGEAVTVTHRPRSTPQNLFFNFCLWYSFQRVNKPQGLVWPEGLYKLIKFNYLVGFRTHDRQACSIVPQPVRHLVPPYECLISF